MLNVICVSIMIGTVGIIIGALYNAVEYRIHGKVFTYTNLALLTTAFYSLFTARTILFYKDYIPADILACVIKVSPKTQDIIDTVVEATPSNTLLDSMFWTFAVFFVGAALIRCITGYVAIRPRFLICFYGLIYTLPWISTADDKLIAKYNTLLMIAFVLWIASVIAVKIQMTIKISRQQKVEAVSCQSGNLPYQQG